MTDVELGAVEGGSRSLQGYLAVPSGDGPWPGVVAIHEIFGLDGNLRRQADRLAAAGYLTLAPDLYSDGSFRRCVVSTMRAMTSGRGRPHADIDAARDWLRADSRCTGKLGVIGFCMGGGFAIVAATRGYDVASVNYGKPPADLPDALAGSCPVVASYGGKDVSLRGAADSVSAAYTALGVEHDVQEYPTAGHAFLDDEYFGPGLTHPVQKILHLGPDPVAAPAAWTRIESFFARHLA